MLRKVIKGLLKQNRLLERKCGGRVLIKIPNSLLSIVTHASHSTPTVLQTMGQASHGFLWSASHGGNTTCRC